MKNYMKKEKIKIIGFDADDTLWVNEPYYKDAEKLLCDLLAEYLPAERVSEELYKTEMTNLHIYGYGAKSFTLSMIETAVRVGGNKLPATIINEIVHIGKALLEKPIELLDNISDLLTSLKTKYEVIVATKGDLLDQQRKLNNSGLSGYFSHVEIMNDKQESDYINLMNKLNIKNEEFLMVGNSLRSDVMPVISIGGQAIHIPYHTTWLHETVDDINISGKYREIARLTDLLDILL